MRSGQVRVLMGSPLRRWARAPTCRSRLIALHDLDCPWRPSDLEQRAGQHPAAGQPATRDGARLPLCHRADLRRLSLPAGGEQAAVHLADHDVKKPCAGGGRRGRGVALLCGDQGAGHWQSADPGEDGCGGHGRPPAHAARQPHEQAVCAGRSSERILSGAGGGAAGSHRAMRAGCGIAQTKRGAGGYFSAHGRLW